MTATGKRWLAGLPAVIALGGGAVLAAWLAVRSPASRVGWYPAAAAAAYAADDFKTAAVCYTRVAQAGPTDAASVYNLAVSLINTGQPDAARGLLLRLAPLEGPSYPPAHVRLARMDLSADQPPPATVADAVTHLAAARKRMPDDAQVAYWSAVADAAAGHWDAVAAAAAKLGDLRPILAKRLAPMAAAQGDKARAAEWARQAGTTVGE